MSWDFSFDQSEIDKALNLIQPIVQKEYIVLSIGSKLPDKDWGDHNWNIVIECITNQNPELGILCIGSKEEKTRSERLTTSWRGPVVNLCGRVNPRISALTMKKALFYLGHDSGPMHLAALVKTPCVAVFSARSKPGVWFPKGDANQILYPWSSLSKASSKTGFRNAGNSIDLITPSEVIKSCSQFLSN